MGNPNGFLKIRRSKAKAQAPEARLATYGEFVIEPPAEALREQASRCMDCGIPFCHQGCPLGNVIPEFNDHVFRGRMDAAARTLESTNNFPEVTGRVCPAPCEAACVLNIENVPVTIKDVERNIASHILASELVPRPSTWRSGRRVAVVGSGPAGLACAQELARKGHDVTLFERDDRIGGLLRYGIPDFKLEKGVLDRRVAQMRAEGVVFEVSTDPLTGGGASELLARFHALVVATGARVPRDVAVPGRELRGVHFAMDFLTQQNRRVAGDEVPDHLALSAKGKRVVVIGGGDTGSDCIGTSLRQGAASVTNLELFPEPPEVRGKANPWPEWPLVLRVSSSHEEGGERLFAVMTERFLPAEGGAALGAIQALKVAIEGGRPVPIEGSRFEIPCDLALLAVGFTGPEREPLERLGVKLDGRGNVVTDESGQSSVPRIFAAGDAQRGQSLVVWAIADGRRVAASVDRFLRRGVPRVGSAA